MRFTTKYKVNTRLDKESSQASIWIASSRFFPGSRHTTASGGLSLPSPSLSFSQGSLLGSLLSRRLFYALGKEKAKEHVSPFFLAHYVKILLSLLVLTEGFSPFVQTSKSLFSRHRRWVRD